MATDNTHLTQSEDVGTSTAQEFNPEVVQIAQADAGAAATGAQTPGGNAAQPAPIPGVPNGEVQVQMPAGQTVVRVQIAPGETIDLPFDGALAAKFGEQGNLAVRVGDQTIILLGYAEANQQEGVTLKDAKGHAVDVATVVAQTDPNLDIQTAAGPAAGPAGQGGHLFLDFNPGAGLGGFGELNVIDPTQLQYGLIQPDETILVRDEDTGPTLISVEVDRGGVVNEDDFHHSHSHSLGNGDGGIVTEALIIDPNHVASDGLSTQLENNPDFGNVSFGNFHNGNDPYDPSDSEDGSQTPGFSDDVGPHHLDQDREPLSTVAHVKVDFHGDFPGTLTFDNAKNGHDVPIIDNLTAMNLTSHGNALQYELLPATADHGQSIIAYYTQAQGEAVSQVVVFSLEIEQPSGTTSQSTFDIAFTIYGTLDNAIQGAGLLGPDSPLTSGEDSFDLNTIFFMNDSDGSVLQSPPNILTFHDIDDVPALGHYDYTYQSTGDGETSGAPISGADTAVHYDPANLTLGLDETPGVQHTQYDRNTHKGDIDPDGSLGQHKSQHTDDVGGAHAWHIEHHAETTINNILAGNPGDPLISYQQSVLDYLNPSVTNGGEQFCAKPLGAASAYLDVSFGADGRAEDNADGSKDIHSGKTLFAHDGEAVATAFQLYMQDPTTATGAPDNSTGNAPIDSHKTNVWISVDDGHGHIIHEQVTAYQLDANTIIGIAAPLEGQGDNGGGDNTPRVALDTEQEGGCEGGIPVFEIHIDPLTGELSMVQYHQVDNPGNGANDPRDILTDDGQPLVHFRATDYDGDHVDAPLEIAITDDAPVICNVTYCSDGTNDHDKGHVDEDYLHSNTNGVPGNFDSDTNPDNQNQNHLGGNDGDGPGSTHVTGQINVQNEVDGPLSYSFDIAGLHPYGQPVVATDANGHPLTDAGGHQIYLSLNKTSGGDWVVTGWFNDGGHHEDAFKVTLDSQTGNFSFDLLAALGHPDTDAKSYDNNVDNGLARYEDDLSLNFGAKVTDVDGDSAKTTLQFVVDDDAPKLVCEPHVTKTITSNEGGDCGDCLQESTSHATVSVGSVPGWVQISVTDYNGHSYDAHLDTATGNGFGVSTNNEGNEDRFHEINADGNHQSESLNFNFGHLVESATVELARFYSQENGTNEQGHWVAYRGTVEVAEGNFTANSTTGQYGLAIPTIPGGFDKLVFTATSDHQGQGGDNSDYLVQELNLNLLPTNIQHGEFSYTFGADNGNLPHDHQAGNGFTVSTDALEHMHLTSGGVGLTYVQSVVNGDIVIYAYKGSDHNEPVFKLDIDPNASDNNGTLTAKYTFTEYGPLDNNGGNHMSNLPFDVTIMDRDGDAVKTQIDVCIDDSKPTTGNSEATVFEKGLDQSGDSHDGTAKGDGSNSTTGFLNFSYNGDGPGQITDINDGHGHHGQDDHNGHLVLNTDQYTLTVDEKTGYYTFTLKQNLDHNDSNNDGYTNSQGTHSTNNPQDILQNLNISYTVQDADHSTATGTLVVHVTDDGPIATCDTFSDVTVTSYASVLIGNVLANDQFGADGKHVNHTTHASEPIVGVNVDGVDGHQNNAGGYDVTLSNGTVHVSQAGDVTFDPALGQTYGAGHTFNLTYTIEDGDGDTSTTTDHFTVKGGNLVPVNVDDAVTVTDETNNSNVMIVFDRSGSMDDDPDVNGFDHRIDLARAALNDLLEKYGENGDVRVMIVDFASSAGSMDHWGTIAEAEAYLNTLHADGNTNYSAALAQAQSAWDLSGKGGADYGNYVYFLSDGKPTTGGEGNDHHLSSSQKDDWDSFLEGHNISDIYAVGVGADISATDQDLKAVADPDNHNNPPGQVIVADDEGKLADDLTHTVQAAVHGNVLDGSLSGVNGADTPGNGPAHVSSFSHGAQVFTWDGSGAVHQSGDATPDFTISGTDVTIVTDKGTMVFHFADGTFDYTPKVVDASTSDVFHYVTTDSDGDVANGADLTININHVNHAPITIDDAVDALSGTPLTIDVSQLLANDSDPDHDILTITSVGGSTKGDVTLVGDQIIFTPTGSGQGGFTYTVNDGHGGITTGHVVVDINAAPTAKDVSFHGNEDTSKINVTLNGSDSDGSISSYRLTDLPTNGTLYTNSSMTQLAVAGTDYSSANFYFKPDANFHGDVSFHYTVVDNQGAADATPATVSITVNSVNDAPDTNTATATGNENTTTPIAVTFSGADIDGSVVGYRLTNLPGNGTLYLNANGTGAVHTGQTYGQDTFYFVPNPNFSGAATFNYAAVDNNGAVDASAALATVTINHVNDLPVAADDHVYTNISGVFTLESAWLTANDSDGDGDPLHVASVVAATVVNLAATPGVDASHNVMGVDISNTGKGASFDYHVNDGHVSSANAGHVTVTYDGTTGNDHSLSGGNGNDIIVHSGTGHTINGNDGADLIADLGSGNTIHGGDGNDHIQVASSTDAIDGGDNDSNNMATNGNQGDVLDLSHLSGNNIDIHGIINHISHIETLDATDTHNQTISLRASDVIDMSDGTFNPNANLPTQEAIKVEGNIGDTLKLDDSNGKWFDVTNTVGNAPADHHVYAYDSGGGSFTASQVTAYVIVSNNVTVHDHNDGAVGAP